MLLEVELPQFNHKNTSKISEFPPKIPKISQNMCEKWTFKQFPSIAGRFGYLYRRQGDSVCL